jgi:hypothetical protein
MLGSVATRRCKQRSTANRTGTLRAPTQSTTDDLGTTVRPPYNPPVIEAGPQRGVVGCGPASKPTPTGPRASLEPGA